MNPYILTLADPRADLKTTGGKGMSLSFLARVGLPVPSGFHITTEAYRRFVNENQIEPLILRALGDANHDANALPDGASKAIHEMFGAGTIPNDVRTSIEAAYYELTAGPGPDSHASMVPVAVSSSATAEDLPDASFAGQQDTFLNIMGIEAVLGAVKLCWASLWTTRAITYRQRQGIAPDQVALAVVVQELFPAEAAGILFTANPINGKRSEVVINAAWGLGEAIVGGVVNPDMIVVKKSSGRVCRRETSEKLVMTIRTASGTQESPVPGKLKHRSVLGDRAAMDLSTLGLQIEELYGTPMDIEWAMADGKFAILQARPITALPDEPLTWDPPDKKGIYLRGSVVDLLPKPLCPLYASLSIPALMDQMQVVGKQITGSEPVLNMDYYTTINGYAYMNARFSARSWWWLLTRMIPAYPRLLGKLVTYWKEMVHPEYRTFVQNQQGIVPNTIGTDGLWQLAQEVSEAATRYVTALLFVTMGASAGSEMLLTRIYDKLVKKEGNPQAAVLLMGWDSIPVRADKSIFDLAEWCRNSPQLADYLLRTETRRLSSQISGGSVPAEIPGNTWQEFIFRFQEHLNKFGHIVFQLDFSEKLPLERPEPMLENIRMYLRGEGTNPHARQKESAKRREQLSTECLSRLKGIKRWIFQKALRWAQSLSEVREDALADIGLGYPLLRSILHTLGERFIIQGVLSEPDDIYWLEKGEVDGLACGNAEQTPEPEIYLQRINTRKLLQERYGKEVPPPSIPVRERLMGFKMATFIGHNAEDLEGKWIKGIPASPGCVTAPACVLLGPEDFDHMQTGCVLVANSTSPAWTPLFNMASAVVTDIGGPLSHGSIVAREYGIPAVMGTGIATRRIRDGQTVTVNGNDGTVVLEPEIP